MLVPNQRYASRIIAPPKSIAHSGDGRGLSLGDLEVRLLEIRLVARRSVDSLVSVVVVDRSLFWDLHLVLKLEVVVLLDDVGVDCLSLADVAALDVVGILVKTTFTVDWGVDGWVVGSGALYGHIEVPGAADGAAEDEVGDVELVVFLNKVDEWCGGYQGGGTEGEDAGEVHFDGSGVVVFELT